MAINAAEAAKNGDPLGFALNALGARASFGKFNTWCFAAGTPLDDSWTTAKPIEEFRAGDDILSRDENDPAAPVALARVEEVFESTAVIVHLHAGGQVIRTTAEHAFWALGRGWIGASELQPGDRLVGHDGETVAVEEVYDTGETERVYNLRIAEYHTYFVGSPEWGWNAWAHNACSGTSGNNLAARAGKQAHNDFSQAIRQVDKHNHWQAPYRLPSGRIADAVNVTERTVLELKPDNARALARGAAQVDQYVAELERVFGFPFRSRVVGY